MGDLPADHSGADGRLRVDRQDEIAHLKAGFVRRSEADDRGHFQTHAAALRR